MLLAAILLPTPWQTVMIAVPLLTAVGSWFLITRTDRIVNHVFPDLAWERSLGWFNIKAERRANTAMHWVRRAIYLLLFDALAVMLWTAKDFPPLGDGSDPWLIGEIIWRLALMALCVIIWLLFLGCGLLPRVRAEREMAALKKYRAEMDELDREREMVQSPSRIHKPLAKPRINAPLTMGTPNRFRRYNQPGG